METDIEETTGRRLAELVARRVRGPSVSGLIRGLLRRIDDEIGEPILVSPGDTPVGYITVSIPEPVGFTVAMSPAAAERILALN